MSLRAFFSRLLSPLANSNRLEHGAAYDRQQKRTWRYYLAQLLIVTTLLLSTIWLLMAIWYQFGIRSPITWLMTLMIVGILAALAKAAYATKRHWSKSPKNRGNQPSNNLTAPDKKVAVNGSSVYMAQFGLSVWVGSFLSSPNKTATGWRKSAKGSPIAVTP